jgi:hypothetical protein
MHPRRLEKNANITLKSAQLPQAVSHARSRSLPMGFNYDADVVIMCHKEHCFNYSFNLRGKKERG